MRLFEHRVVKFIDDRVYSEPLVDLINKGWKVIQIHPIGVTLEDKGWSGAIYVLRRSFISRWRFDREDSK